MRINTDGVEVIPPLRLWNSRLMTLFFHQIEMPNGDLLRLEVQSFDSANGWTSVNTQGNSLAVESTGTGNQASLELGPVGKDG